MTTVMLMPVMDSMEVLGPLCSLRALCETMGVVLRRHDSASIIMTS